MPEESKSWIPSISKRRLQELSKRIKPIIRFARGPEGFFKSKEGFPYYLEPVHLENVAYTWDPKPTSRATGLKALCDITTYHEYGYQGFFKPSIAEVLAQIPKEHLDQVIAFEIVAKPEMADDLNRNHGATNAGYHVATTRLYVATRRSKTTSTS